MVILTAGKRLFSILSLAATSALLFAQPIHNVSVADKVAWLTDHAVAIRSIDPRDKDYTDLRPLRQSIGAARIVLLGGVPGPAVANAKYRLVRFLHEEMGFDVLASAADPLDVDELDRALDRGAHPHTLPRSFFDLPFETLVGPGRGPVLPIVSINLLDYVHATHKGDHPLHLAGVGQNDLFFATDRAKQLFQFVDRVNPILASLADRKAIRSLITVSGLAYRPRFDGRAGPFTPGPQQWGKVLPAGLAALARLYEGLGHLPAGSDAGQVALYRQAIAYAAWYSSVLAGHPPEAPPPDSLALLAKVLRPESRIVVWSVNGAAEKLDDREFGASAYSIGFTETRTAGELLEVLVAGAQPSLAPADDHLESLLHATGKPYSFVDLRSLPRDHWLRRPMTGRFTEDAQVATWPEKYDAVFYVDLTKAKPKK